MEFPQLLQMLYSVAEEYGIPSPAVDVLIVFALVLFLGRPIISLFIRISYRRFSELSPETRESYIGVLHIAALAISTLCALLDIRLAMELAFLLLVIVPLVLGFVVSRKKGRDFEEAKKVQSPREVSLQQALIGRKRYEKKEEERVKDKRHQERSKFRFPIPLPKKASPSKMRKTKEKPPEEHRYTGPTLIVEEIVPEKKPAKKPEEAPSPKVPPTIHPYKESPPKEVPAADALKVREFRRAVTELEILAKKQNTATPSPSQHSIPTSTSKQTSTAVKAQKKAPKAINARPKVIPTPSQPKPTVDEGSLVKELEKVVEEKVISARKHKFITWREALEMRKRARETVKRMEPVFKEHVRKRLRERGTITKEDLDEIAEELLYQIQRSETPTVSKKEPKKERQKGHHKREKNEKKKKEEEETLLGGEEEADLLALLGEEETEEETESDLEELEKLLGEE